MNNNNHNKISQNCKKDENCHNYKERTCQWYINHHKKEIVSKYKEIFSLTNPS